MKRCLVMCFAIAALCWFVQAAPPPASLSPSSLPTIEKVPAATPEEGMRPRVLSGTLDEGGETCSAAVAITGLPFTGSGYTCDNLNDYDYACPYTDGTARDVVYSFSPSADMLVSVGLCNSYFDTKLYIYDTVCQNPPLYCNDDACSGPNYTGGSYLSLLPCKEFLAGHTYYIIVDGYGTDCGEYILDLWECVPPACPATSIYSQPAYLPEEGGNAFTSDANAQFTYLAYDNFEGVEDPICDLHFWGFSLNYAGNWFVCDEDPMTFEITFYDSVWINGVNMPGPEVCSYTATLTRQSTGFLFGNFPLWRWDVHFDTCCTLNAGWVSIQGISNPTPNCSFLWMTSPIGDDRCLQTDESGAPISQAYDLAFCLTPGMPAPEMDMGDIIHPLNQPFGYPTQVANPGHLLSGVAWLGANISGEPVPNVFELDPFDDGVQFPPFMIPCTPTSVTVTVTGGPNYQGQPLFLSAWKDGNNDGDFCDNLCPAATGAPTAPEWIIQDIPVVPGVWVFTIMDPGLRDVPPYSGWFRFRLCSVPVGPLGFGLGLPPVCPGTFGVDELGEVEDYWIEDYQLAVELTSFDATAGAGEVTLSWITASETGNDYFELTRNGTLVDRIPTQGNGPGGHTYRYVDGDLENDVTYQYVLYAIDLNGTREEIAFTSATPVAEAAVITDYALHQNYPNPFNPTTKISFDLVDNGWVSLTVFNVVGQQVASVIEASMEAGHHTVVFNAANLPTGIYWYKLTVNDFSATRKMLLVK